MLLDDDSTFGDVFCCGCQTEVRAVTPNCLHKYRQLYSFIIKLYKETRRTNEKPINKYVSVLSLATLLYKGRGLSMVVFNRLLR